MSRAKIEVVLSWCQLVLGRQKDSSCVIFLSERINLGFSHWRSYSDWCSGRLGSVQMQHGSYCPVFHSSLLSNLAPLVFSLSSPCKWRLCDCLLFTRTCPAGVRDSVRGRGVFILFGRNVFHEMKLCLPKRLFNKMATRSKTWVQILILDNWVTWKSLSLFLCRMAVTSSIQQCCQEDYCKCNHI